MSVWYLLFYIIVSQGGGPAQAGPFATQEECVAAFNKFHALRHASGVCVESTATPSEQQL